MALKSITDNKQSISNVDSKLDLEFKELLKEIDEVAKLETFNGKQFLDELLSDKEKDS